jgi:hypothetical protein
VAALKIIADSEIETNTVRQLAKELLLERDKRK